MFYKGAKIIENVSKFEVFANGIPHDNRPFEEFMRGVQQVLEGSQQTIEESQQLLVRM